MCMIHRFEIFTLFFKVISHSFVGQKAVGNVQESVRFSVYYFFIKQPRYWKYHASIESCGSLGFKEAVINVATCRSIRITYYKFTLFLVSKMF